MKVLRGRKKQSHWATSSNAIYKGWGGSDFENCFRQGESWAFFLLIFFSFFFFGFGKIWAEWNIDWNWIASWWDWFWIYVLGIFFFFFFLDLFTTEPLSPLSLSLSFFLALLVWSRYHSYLLFHDRLLSIIGLSFSTSTWRWETLMANRYGNKSRWGIHVNHQQTEGQAGRDKMDIESERLSLLLLLLLAMPRHAGPPLTTYTADFLPFLGLCGSWLLFTYVLHCTYLRNSWSNSINQLTIYAGQGAKLQHG